MSTQRFTPEFKEEAVKQVVDRGYDRCRFSLEELAYQYPEERLYPDLPPQKALEKLTWEGAVEQYPEGLPDKVRANLNTN